MDEERLAESVANASSHFINENKLCIGNFDWQNTCSAFSVCTKKIIADISPLRVSRY